MLISRLAIAGTLLVLVSIQFCDLTTLVSARDGVPGRRIGGGSRLKHVPVLVV